MKTSRWAPARTFIAVEKGAGTLYPSEQTHRIGTQGLDAGTRQRRFQDSVSQCARRTLERHRCPAHGRTPRGHGTKDLPYVGEQTRLTSRTAPRHGHGTLAGRRGSRSDRALARTRVGRTTQIYLDADLSLKEQVLAK